MTQRILGLDYGSKTVGVAVSDPMGWTAQPLETIHREREGKLRRTLARIEALAQEYQADKIVVGLPKNMNNTLGERAARACEFGDMLRARTGLEVEMWDERLTTEQAKRILIQANVRRENQKQYLDEMAAALILQSWLDARTPVKELACFPTDED
ncbi:MAG: Holliday junction resolvase RuvX [Blautia sp.]|nr:Holliday junction resolvase RuvX [Blautia sp.]